MSRSTSSSSTTEPPDGLLEVGHIRRAHGLRGEVFVQLTTDVDVRVEPGSQLMARGRTLVVQSSRRAANGRRIVKFDAIDDRTVAESWVNQTLYAAPLDDPDALWVHELIGARVRESDGTDRGVCVSVVANPAADLLELDSGALVPVTFVVSNADGVVTVDAPDGLFDLGDG